MRRPPAGFALAVVLGACANAPSAARAPVGGSGGTPAVAARPEQTHAAQPSELELLAPEMEPREAERPDRDHVESESSEGNGSGFGRGVGGLGPRINEPPDVIPLSASVEGPLDKEIIRRIVRRHIDEVKYCYERELVTKRRLRGKATVDFTIAPRGDVVTARLQRSTLRAPRVESCLVAAIRRWEFPYWEIRDPAAREVVTVSYPFYFVPGSRDYVPKPPVKPGP